MEPDKRPKIIVKCAKCGKSYGVKPELAGRTATCGCGAKLQIPPATGPVTPNAAASRARNAAKKPSAPPAPTSASDEGDYEIEAHDPIATPTPAPAIRSTALGSSTETRSTPRDEGGGESTALRLLGLFGFMIMGRAVLGSLIIIGLSIHLALRPNVSLGIGLLILTIGATATAVNYVLFRLGRGLVDCERRAVIGIAAIYVLAAAYSACVLLMGNQATGIFAGITPAMRTVLQGSAALFLVVDSLFIVPPILIGFWSWKDLRSADD